MWGDPISVFEKQQHTEFSVTWSVFGTSSPCSRVMCVLFPSYSANNLMRWMSGRLWSSNDFLDWVGIEPPFITLVHVQRSSNSNSSLAACPTCPGTHHLRIEKGEMPPKGYAFAMLWLTRNPCPCSMSQWSQTRANCWKGCLCRIVKTVARLNSSKRWGSWELSSCHTTCICIRH